jgi:hypothetical protein
MRKPRGRITMSVEPSENAEQSAEPPPGTELVPIAPRVTAVDSEGFIYDVETGEVLGHETVSEDPVKPFEVDSVEAAEWVLEKRSRIEANILAVEARINALVASLERQRGHFIRQLAWWEYRFQPTLVRLARSLLKGKSRTVNFDHGKVAFRTSKGTNTIIDDQAALAYVRMWCPEKVHVKEWVNVADVLAARQLAAEVAEEDPSQSLPFLVSSGPSENVTVETGIGLKPKAARPAPREAD